MNFNADKYENYTIVKISEEKIDSSVAPELKSEFMTLSQDGVKSIIIDMSDVKYVTDGTKFLKLSHVNFIFARNFNVKHGNLTF